MSTYYNYNTGDGINLATEADRTITEPQGLGPVVPGLDIPPHDYISLTYVAAGNGLGEIETVTYKSGGASGITVAITTLAYDSNNELISITKV